MNDQPDMNSTTAKARVLAEFPAAYVEKKGFSYFIRMRTRNGSGMSGRLLGHGRMTEIAAWEDALQCLENQHDR